MSSGTSTERVSPAGDSGFRVGHFYLLLSLCGATGAVVLSRHTHPAALLLISGAVMASGYAAFALHTALAGFWGGHTIEAPISEGTREHLEREKALVLRTIKELEFDHAMRKVTDADFAEMSGRLRAKALSLMQDLERPVEAGAELGIEARAEPRIDAPAELGIEARAEPGIAAPAAVISERTCAACRTVNDVDAKFCKQCGGRLGDA